MFICCKTKVKKPKQPTDNTSEVKSFNLRNNEDEMAGDKGEDLNQEPDLKESNQTEESHQEIEKIVNTIKAYRDDGKLKESIDMERVYINGVLAEDLPIIYFIEYRWALHYTGFLEGKKKIQPKEINNNKILRFEHKLKDTIYITIDNDPQLLSGIQPEKHYSLLNEKTWKFIHQLYGGGPTITIDLENVKQIIEQDKNQESNVEQEKGQLQAQSIEQTNDEPINVLPSQLGTQLELIYDAATHVTATTIVPLKMSTDPQIHIKFSTKNIDDFDKTPSGNLFDKNQTVSTKIVKIYSKVPIDLPIVGFFNPKFFCYMNATLQCLLSISILNQKMLKIQIFNDRQFTTAYQNLIKLIQATIPGNSITADLLYYVCQNRFKETQQQDSHEFLLFLLSQIQEEQMGKKFREKKEYQSALEAWEVYRGKNPDVITELFAGQVTNRNYCLKCKQTSEVYDPILDLNLPLQNYPGIQEININDCLCNYFREEHIFNEWKCNNCSYTNKFVVRKVEITQKPQFLIIHLKRFAQFPKNQKIQNAISYPQILNIKEFCNENIMKAEYRLKSLISHQGQLNSGHYKAFAKRKDEWYEFDDDVITKDNRDRHLSDKGAYILFYEAI